MSMPPPAARREILDLLGRITHAVEELLLTGLSSASTATCDTLSVSFQAASKMRLLRLGSTLRAAVEEIGRFTRDDPMFSRQRFSFFLNRAWMLARGLAEALEHENEAHWDSLTVSPPAGKATKLELVVIGVSKRVVPNAFCAFEFRLMTLKKAGTWSKHSILTWSSIFPLKAGLAIPPEGYLHLPQKQKFKAISLLEGTRLTFTKVMISEAGRISLTDDSTVVPGAPFEDWNQVPVHDLSAMCTRIKAAETNPFALDIEFQENVIIDPWSLGELGEADREGKQLLALETPGAQLHVTLRDNSFDQDLLKRLKKWSKKKSRPKLYGVMHYEANRMMFQPLSVLTEDQADYLMISDKNIDPKKLLRALDFSS